jgi:ribosome-associated protein
VAYRHIAIAFRQEYPPMSSNSPDMPETIHEDLGGGAWVRPADMRFTFSRGAGPGGQSVNKVSTAATMHVAITAIEGMSEAARRRLRRLAGRRLTAADDLVFQARAQRSQLDNRRACVQRLRELVGTAQVAPKRRKKTKPSRGAIERRLRAKREKSEKKQRRRPSD